MERNCYVKNAYIPKVKMAAAAILYFKKMLPFLYYWTNPHQIYWECCESNMEYNCYVENAYLQQLKMAAAAIWNFEK